MRMPTIHSNGTSRTELFDNYYRAIEAVTAAIDALRATAPNGRDYYVQNLPHTDASVEAMREHRARVAALETVKTDLEALCEHVA
jgi:hypothetical protein